MPSILSVPPAVEPKVIVPLKAELTASSSVELLPIVEFPASAPVSLTVAPGEGLGAEPVSDPEKLVIVMPAELQTPRKGSPDDEDYGRKLQAGWSRMKAFTLE